MAGITTPDKFPFSDHPKHKIVKSLTCDGYIHAVTRNPGDIIYSENGTILSRLPSGQEGDMMTVGLNGRPSWGLPDTGGVVTGPNGATDNALARYNQNTGKLIKNSVVLCADNGNITGVNDLSATTINNNPPSTGDLTGPMGSNANAVVRYDQNTGKLIKNSAVTISDNGNIVGVNNINLTSINTNPVITSISGIHVTNWTGVIAETPGNVKFTKQGSLVVLEIPTVIANGIANGDQIISTVLLPNFLRPQEDPQYKIAPIAVTQNGVIYPYAQFYVRNNGSMSIIRGSFTIGPNRGFYSINISYSTDPIV